MTNEYKSFFTGNSALPRGKLAKELTKKIKPDASTERVWKENERKIEETKKWKVKK